MSGEWRDDPKNVTNNVTNIAVVNLPAIAPVIAGIARAPRSPSGCRSLPANPERIAGARCN